MSHIVTVTHTLLDNRLTNAPTVEITILGARYLWQGSKRQLLARTLIRKLCTAGPFRGVEFVDNANETENSLIFRLILPCGTKPQQAGRVYHKVIDALDEYWNGHHRDSGPSEGSAMRRPATRQAYDVRLTSFAELRQLQDA
ncbi:MAG TPA: hypothetical protein VF597_03355 [Candidatus Saccharimonadales bacterium]|jgi:hypothetical protein